MKTVIAVYGIGLDHAYANVTYPCLKGAVSHFTRSPVDENETFFKSMRTFPGKKEVLKSQ